MPDTPRLLAFIAGMEFVRAKVDAPDLIAASADGTGDAGTFGAIFSGFGVELR